MGNSQSNTNNETKNKTEEFRRDLESQLQSVALSSSPDARVIKTKSRRPIKPAPQLVQSIELDAQPIQGENESIVTAFDGRTQVLTTAQWPNSVHGVIAFKVQNIKKWGTGILIGPNVVLTAGHNLYDFQHKVLHEVQGMQFLPGMNGQILPFGVVGVEKSFVSPNYIKEGKEDYGILVLKEPVGEVAGYFGLACLEPEEFEGKRINVTGYPGDKVASKPNTCEMWGMEGTAANIDKTRGYINYLIDTGTGQSGSGVWYKEGEDYYVCGVHVTGTEFVNTATLLTRAMYKQIYAWIQQRDFQEFLLGLGDFKELMFAHMEINAECASILIKYNLNDLTTLDFHDTKMGKEGVRIIAQNNTWANFSKLTLPESEIGAEGAKELAQNISWTNLSYLNLYCNWIGAEGAKALAQNVSWINLSQLDLSFNKLGAEGAKALAKNTSWVNLLWLNLKWNDIDAEGAKGLAQNTSWINLSGLELAQNQIDTEGAKALAQNTSWRNLSRLNLSRNKLDAEGAKALAQNTSWTKLSRLIVKFNRIDVEGLKALEQNSSWSKLSFRDY